MRSEEFFEIIDGIDDDIILDVPEMNSEKPIKVVVEHKRTPLWAVTLSAACLLCVLMMGILLIAKLQSSLPVISGSSDPTTSDDSSNESDSNSSNSDSSDSSDENSDPEQDDVLDRISLMTGDLPDPDLLNATAGLECKTLLTVQPQNYLSIRGIYLAGSCPVIWASDNTPNYHYFWIDPDGNELDHVAFDVYNSRKEVIPNRDYPGTGVFGPFEVDGIREVRYYQNGKLQKAVQIPKGYRSDFTPDQSQYIYIDDERKDLTLYDLKTGSDIKALSVGDLGYGDSWVMAFVNIVTPKLATVTLFDYDTNSASEWQGGETLHTFLLELPTLNIIQRLPDSAELMALDDENFLMTKQAGEVRRISRAKLENGKLIETETEFIINETSQYFNFSNIILSSDKKVALIRDWDYNVMRCRAVSTDTMQLIWEFRLSGGETIPTGFYTPAAITDDAVLYLFGDTLNSDDDQPLYRVSMRN